MSQTHRKRPKAVSLRQIQREVDKWCLYNFGNVQDHLPLLGVVEELGELAHAWLKKEQGVRGTPAQHTAKMQDAVGDLAVFLLNFCCRHKWDFQDILVRTWAKVKPRDWKRFPLDGVSK